jgi:hypothetical protein
MLATVDDAASGRPGAPASTPPVTDTPRRPWAGRRARQHAAGPHGPCRQLPGGGQSRPDDRVVVARDHAAEATGIGRHRDVVCPRRFPGNVTQHPLSHHGWVLADQAGQPAGRRAADGGAGRPRPEDTGPAVRAGEPVPAPPARPRRSSSDAVPLRPPQRNGYAIVAAQPPVRPGWSRRPPPTILASGAGRAASAVGRSPWPAHPPPPRPPDREGGAMPTQPPAAAQTRHDPGHRQIILARIPRRDAAQRLSLAFSLLARAVPQSHGPAPPAAASPARPPAARPAPPPPPRPLTPTTERRP